MLAENTINTSNLDKSGARPAPFTFIDLFAGIGGFHIAMSSVGGQCVFASEWDKFARMTYEANYRPHNPELFDSNRFNWDINQAKPEDIPDFDVMCAGFPCQPFSHAGLKKGFEDTRGTLFFRLAEIVKHKSDAGKKPKVLFLENVKGLKSHDKGNTLRRIQEILEDDLGYSQKTVVLNSKYFGVPQNRERLFIVAIDSSMGLTFQFPFGLTKEGFPIYDPTDLELAKPTRVGNILDPNPPQKYTISDRLYQGHLRRRQEHAVKGNGFGFSLFSPDSAYTSTISARYYKDGSEILIDQGEHKNPRKLTPDEARKLQGYPDGFVIPVTDVQAYKQFGNSVSVPVIKAIANEIKQQVLQ
nr:DNA (cytosine-5-)-methyltransferase [uncultured Arsenicibacter sp.]